MLVVLLPKEESEIEMSDAGGAGGAAYDAVKATAEAGFGYLLFRPQGFSSEHKWPLLIYLHGVS